MNQMFVMMNDLGRKTLKAARQFSEINLQTADRLTQQQMDLFSENLERGMSVAKRLNDVSGYKGLLNVQTEIAQELTEATAAYTRQTFKVITEAGNSVNDLFQKETKETRADIAQVASGKVA